MLPDLTLLKHIFVSLLADLAEEGLPIGQELEGFGTFFGIKFLKPLFFDGRGCHTHDIHVEEEVSEINKQSVVQRSGSANYRSKSCFLPRPEKSLMESE